ncbi:hypothetical protein PILCRDRAFT_144601 [Piloderma croceum F 1598]|uniref:Elongator complex protein 2 n=1 Tax=Piloderma croceum (strain F 1598) TaxID=765440 RepID=A0A0C3G388_PILCF|nr:hypothetical protein PILCRDRAFT_144601 [Piloderma croceum F 1598]
MAHVSVAYISASTNRHNRAADVSSESLVAFGSSKLIALWDSANKTDHGIFETLPGHEGLVTCVQFIRDNHFVSADDVGTLRCWRKIGPQWIPTGFVKAHSKAVSALCVLDENIVTGSSDASVKIWKVCPGERSDDLQEQQVLQLQGKYPLSLALSRLPQIWTRSYDVFVRSAVLSGHEDWVRSLAFRVPLYKVDHEPLILASGSQDGTIRLWNVETFSKDTPERVQSQADTHADELLSDELLDDFEASLGDLTDAEEGGRQISLKRHVLTVKDEGLSRQFSITFDALLIGHETSTLLSTSTDSSLILWSPSTILSSASQDGSTSIWINRQRFGDIGGQRLGGFVGGLWGRDGMEAMAWGWAGGWRRWRGDRCDQHVGEDAIDGEEWAEVGAVGGHNGAVKGLDWSPKGEYLISAGIDQTSRIHGAIPIRAVDGSTVESWHEISRPQVHGYDLVDVAFLDALKFVSIADEKVARVFEAPLGFVRVIKGTDISELMSDENARPLGASVPPLGLSNKALTDVAPSSHAGAAVRRPFDGELALMTLWPEIEKVFGHGYESISLAASNSKHLIATACKATTTEHAVVRVYGTEKWQLFGQPLEGHSLTVTRIAFSPDDKFILSVSRDRSWRLFENQDGTGFVPVAADKSHGRIIWGCAWAQEGGIFATASRDKTVKIWMLADKGQGKKWAPTAIIKTLDGATAVAFAPNDGNERWRLAVGLETGGIHFYSSTPKHPSSWNLDISLDSRTAHVDHVYRLAWRPTNDNPRKELASSSEDGTMKILIVHVGVN